MKQGSEIVVDVTNEGDLDATVHWHGLRLENRFDGVPHDTQKPIPVGGSFTYRIRFPDECLYWYHPHIREDYTIDMGLYGNIVVEPADPDYWPPSDRDVVLAIDDFLLEAGKAAVYERSAPDHMAMGRFGNVLLVNGALGWSSDARHGEVVRFFLTNTANTRVFNLRINGAQMKLVGGDSGRYEREAFVDDVLIAPCERAVVDVLFDRPGEATLEHVTPDRVYPLGRITVSGNATASSAACSFATLRHSPDLETERTRIQEDIEREPYKTLALVAEMDDPTPAGDEPVIYACAMHPDVVSQAPGRCPKCGMKRLAQPAHAAEPEPAGPRFACPMDPEVVSDNPDRCPKCGMKLVPIELVPAALELLDAPRADHAHDEPEDPETHAHAAGSIEWGRHDGRRQPYDEREQHALAGHRS